MSAPATVLVIDDSAVITMTARAILARAGHHVLLAGTRAEGLATAREHAPDVVLLDAVLPDADETHAEETVRALREAGAGRVLMCSGLDASELPAADGHVAKPLAADRLLAAVAGAVSG
jgi:CheY-like chemotaxis protein